jgi:hypothetical protein
MVAIVPLDELNVEAASPPSLDTAEAAVPVDIPASKDVLPLERPTQEEPPLRVDRPPCLVKKVVISEPVAVLVKKVVISEREKPVGDARSEPLVDQALSMVAIVPIDEPNVEAASAPSLDVLPLERPTQEELPSRMDYAPSFVKKVIVSEPEAALVKRVVISEPQIPVGDALSEPLVDQALSMVAIVPIDEPDVEAASAPSLDVLPLERPTQEEPPSRIDHVPSFNKKVVVSEPEAALVKRVSFLNRKNRLMRDPSP